MDPTGQAAAHAALAPWTNYYVITGSAAAALTGLQFVVQTLIAGRNVSAPAPTEHTTAAFGSPTVVHFTAALLLSAGLSAPWPSLAALHGVLFAAGLVGLAYAGVVLRRTRRQAAYRPVLEDWVWHIVLPAVAYGGVAAAGLVPAPGAALFVVAAMTLLLLCVGIHNAWDAVAYVAARPASRAQRATDGPPLLARSQPAGAEAGTPADHPAAAPAPVGSR